jgi:hypothetical protein
MEFMGNLENAHIMKESGGRRIIGERREGVR